MKFLILALLLVPAATVCAKEELRDIQKKHRALRHKENKKWKQMEEDCKNKFPKRYDTNHPDYDAHFACSEKIKDTQAEFEDKLKAEICEKVGVSCKEDKGKSLH